MDSSIRRYGKEGQRRAGASPWIERIGAIAVLEGKSRITPWLPGEEKVKRGLEKSAFDRYDNGSCNGPVATGQILVQGVFGCVEARSFGLYANLFSTYSTCWNGVSH